MGCLTWLIRKLFLVIALGFFLGAVSGLISPTAVALKQERVISPRPADTALKLSFYIPSRGGVNCAPPCSVTASGESIHDWEWTPDVVRFGIACPRHLSFYTEIYFQDWNQTGVCIDRGGAIQDHGSYMWVDVLVSDDHDHLLPFRFGEETTAWNVGDDSPSLVMGGLYDTASVSTSRLHGDPAFPDFLGVDVSGGCGVPIYAPFDGIVTAVGWETGWVGPYASLDDPHNSYIEIQSTNGRDTLFMYHGDYTVSSLQPVRKGDQIGREASRGNSTGCHSHVVLRRDGTVVNYLDHAASFGGSPERLNQPRQAGFIASAVDSLRKAVSALN